MKEMGYSLSEIAAELEFVDVSSVVQCLKQKYTQESSFLGEEMRGTLLALQIGRYESIIRGSYQSAMLGDPKSADIVLKAMNEENKLTRLLENDSTQVAQVLVIAGQETEYIEGLKRAAS